MARAIEVVEWHIAMSRHYMAAAKPGSMVESVWSEKISAFETILDSLKRELVR